MVARQRLDLPGATTGLQRRLQRQERNAPLGFSSITRGGLRVQSPDGIQVKTVTGGAPGMRVTGLQIVDGTLRITGTLEGGGTWVWSGTLTQTGTSNLNGPWNLNGPGTIAGDVTQTGNTTQQGNVNVTGGGKITAGNIEINPSANGGTIKVGGHSIYVSGAVLTILHASGNQVVLNNGGVSLVAGTKSLAVQTSGVSLNGLPTIPRASANNATVGSLYIDSAGQVYRVVN
ncbi:hypothetical protein [Microbacterium sp. XT11]|uniref:hypothetical protein n=1 Tax=Microbacterium sp. XT11 TaxID=367477 RepID=UPI00082D86D3|nr:hypothetical protein [Microbacterium sp. XT11]